MAKSVVLGRDIQEWIVRGLEHVAMQTPPPQTFEVQAMVKMTRAAQLIVYLFPEDEQGDIEVHG